MVSVDPIQRAMRARRGPAAVVAALALIATAMAPPRAAAEALRTHRTPHYQVSTNLPKPLAALLARHVEAVHRAYRERFSAFEARRAERRPLYLFAEKAHYMSFLRREGIQGAGSGGMFFVRGDDSGLVAFLAKKSLTRMTRVLQHEGFHQFAWARLGPNLPVWANEGMAEYFGEAILVDGRLETGLVPPTRLERLRRAVKAGRHVPFSDLLAMSSETWRRRVQAGKGQVLYDQAWAMVHFLVHGAERYRAAFDDYLRALSEGADPTRAFKNAFGEDAARPFERAWRRGLARFRADPLKEAERRLRFLARGVRFLAEQGDVPVSLPELRRRLRRVQFEVRQSFGEGLTVKRSAKSPRNFRAPRAVQGSRLEIQPPSRRGAWPELVMRGLSRPVRLTWEEGPGGRRLSRVVYGSSS
jgi:hypothetical protein